METKTIKIAVIESKYGGNVTSVNDLLTGLPKDAFDIIFIYLTGTDSDENHLAGAGYKVYYLSRHKKLRRFRFSIVFKLAKILKAEHVDIVHCHRHKASCYGALAARLAKVAVVLSHVHGLGRTRNFKRRLVNFFLFRQLTRVLCVAGGVREDVMRNNWFVPAEKLVVLENSVDFERFADVAISKTEGKRLLGVPSEAFVFGTAGRLVPTKGLQYLVKAFSRVKRELPAAHLVILGDGPCRGDLEQQAREAGLSDSIHLPGRMNNIEQLYKAMDVFVLSSIAEGMPRVIMEAMAAAVPCVCTDVGGITEVINGTDVGFLVQARDSSALADAMLTVAKMSPKEYKQLACNGQDRIRQFYRHEVVRQKLRSIYESEFQASRQHGF